MPEGRKRLARALGALLSVKADKIQYFHGLLGAYVGGLKALRVASRPDFVWVRLRGATTEVIQAFNETVSLHWDLPVLVYRDPNAPDIWKVAGRDVRQYEDWGGVSYLPPHADAHSFSGRPNTGSDPVWIYKRQYMPMLPHPVASGTMGIYIDPDFYYWKGRYYWWPGSGTVSLAGHKPTGGNNARFVTVFIDGDVGNPAYLDGPEFNAIIPPGSPGAYILAPEDGIPLAAVLLLTGTVRLGWGEIYDLRPSAFLLPPSGTAISIFEESIYRGFAQGINFTGAGVDVAFSGTYAHVNVTSAGGGGGIQGVPIYEDGAFIGTGTALDFGYGLVASMSGTRALVQAAPPVSGSVIIRDEGLPLGSAYILDFVGPGVTAEISGGYARISIPGGGGGSGIQGIMGLDDGVPVGTGTSINVRYGLGLSISGSVLDLTVTPPVTGTVQMRTDGSGSYASIDQFTLFGNVVQELQVGSILFVRIPYSTGSLSFRNEAVPIGQGFILDFAGAGVDASRSGTYVRADIPGGATLWDDGVPLGFATTLDLGYGLDATLSGTVADVRVMSPVTGSVIIRDDGLVLGSAHILDFGAGLEVEYSGTYAKITNSGGPAAAARVRNSVAITVADSTYTPITFDTEDYDTDTMHDLVTNPGRLTCKTAGKYSIKAGIAWEANATGLRYHKIVHNGTTVIAETQLPVPGANEFYVQLGTDYDLAENDYVTVEVWQNSGGGLDLQARANSSPVLAMHRIASAGAGGVGVGSGPGATYVRAGNAIPLAGPTGLYWQVPETYATGTLSIMVNGVWQRPVTDYTEQYAASGTFALGSILPTGSVLAAIWGVAGSTLLEAFDNGALLGTVSQIDAGAGIDFYVSGSRALATIEGSPVQIVRMFTGSPQDLMVTAPPFWTGAPAPSTSSDQGYNMWVMPLVVHRRMMLHRLEVTSTIARPTGTLRLGIYADSGLQYPGQLLADILILNASGSAKRNTLFPNLILEPGVYWPFVQRSGSGSFFAITTAQRANFLGSPPGLSQGFSHLSPGGGVESAAGYANGPPNPFPLTGTAMQNATVPIMGMVLMTPP